MVASSGRASTEYPLADESAYARLSTPAESAVRPTCRRQGIAVSSAMAKVSPSSRSITRFVASVTLTTRYVPTRVPAPMTPTTRMCPVATPRATKLPPAAVKVCVTAVAVRTVPPSTPEAYAASPPKISARAVRMRLEPERNSRPAATTPAVTGVIGVASVTDLFVGRSRQSRTPLLVPDAGVTLSIGTQTRRGKRLLRSDTKPLPPSPPNSPSVLSNPPTLFAKSWPE